MKEKLLNIIPLIIFTLLCILLFGNLFYNVTTTSTASESDNENPTQEAVDTEWIPWQVNEEWTAQIIPEFEVTEESHQNFINFINKFNSNVKPWDVWNVEHFYWLKEWTIACIAFAETSMGTRWYWPCNNIGNVWNNDRGNRHCYATVQGWLEAMWQTLNNQYLWSKITLGCLSNAGHCWEARDNGKRWASSTSSRENNVVNCLEAIYQQEVDPSTFNFRI